jgi:hypothetical protein
LKFGLHHKVYVLCVARCLAKPSRDSREFTTNAGPYSGLPHPFACCWKI